MVVDICIYVCMYDTYMYVCIDTYMNNHGLNDDRFNVIPLGAILINVVAPLTP
jgi:hypothetical protein